MQRDQAEVGIKPLAEHADDHRAASPGWIIVLIALTVCVFARASFYDFLTEWDDGQNVALNPDLNPPTFRGVADYWRRPKMELYIPLTYTVWAAMTPIARTCVPDDTGATLNPYVYHILNIAVHVASVCVLFSVLRRLVGSDVAAFCGAALFAIHPLQVEPVIWITGLKDVLSGFLSLSSLRLFIAAIDRWATRGRAWPMAVGAIVVGVSAGLAKPAAITLPLLAGVIDWMILKGSVRRVVTVLVVGLLAFAPLALITLHSQSRTQAMWFVTPLADRPVVALDALAFYARKVVAPGAMLIDYARSPWWLLHHADRYWTWTIPVMVGVSAWACRRRIPELAGGALVFVAALLPVLGLTPFFFQDTSTVGDRYAYVAMIGSSLALAGVLGRFRRATWLAGAAGFALLAAAVWSVLQVPHWRDEPTLFAYERLHVPASIAVSLGESTIAERHHDPRAAARCLLRFAEALPEVSDKYRYIARIHLRLGDWDAAISAAKKAIDMDPQNPMGPRDLAAIQQLAEKARSKAP